MIEKLNSDDQIWNSIYEPMMISYTSKYFVVTSLLTHFEWMTVSSRVSNMDIQDNGYPGYHSGLIYYTAFSFILSIT